MSVLPAIDLGGFLGRLQACVALETVSPLTSKAVEAISTWLRPFGVLPISRDIWGRAPKTGRSWAYSHIDTKAPEPLEMWRTNPFELRRVGTKLIGLGVSDAKAQLLNMLELVAESPLGIIVDGGEESGASGAGEFLEKTGGVETLILVDGSTDGAEVYAGTAGQIDGVLTIDTGIAGQHPSRGVRRDVTRALQDLLAVADSKNLHFNITGLNSPVRNRSLTLEEVTVRFDCRYLSLEEGDAAWALVNRYTNTVRQHYPLLGGCGANGTLATFSTPLGAALKTVATVRVAAGARAENGAHCPNEWIDLGQILCHRARLSAALAEVSTD